MESFWTGKVCVTMLWIYKSRLILRAKPSTRHIDTWLQCKAIDYHSANGFGFISELRIFHSFLNCWGFFKKKLFWFSKTSPAVRKNTRVTQGEENTFQYTIFKS